MPSLSETVQTNIRLVTLTSGMYWEDWHALCDQAGIAKGQINERILAYYQKTNSLPATFSSAYNYYLLNPGLIAGFNPATQFAPAFSGFWYDPSDYTTLSQDSPGTTPVTAVTQPVGLMLDKRLNSAFVAVGGYTFTRTAGDGVLSVAGNAITVTGATVATQIAIGSDIPFAPGQTRARIRADYAGATGVQTFIRGAFAALSAGVSTLIAVALNNSGLDRFDVTTGTVTFNILEFSYWRGNHISQATALSISKCRAYDIAPDGGLPIAVLVRDNSVKELAAQCVSIVCAEQSNP